MIKNFLLSKTIWFNVLTAIVVFATVYGYQPDSEVVKTTEGVLIALSPVVNIVLRFLTSKGITLS